MNHKATPDTLTPSPGASPPPNAVIGTAPSTRMAWSTGGWWSIPAEGY